jgi:hypothetical protein
MEKFAGAVGNWHQGVFFTEGTLTGSISSKGRVHVEISRQNSNLSEVKNELARQARYAVFGHACRRRRL